LHALLIDIIQVLFLASQLGDGCFCAYKAVAVSLFMVIYPFSLVVVRVFAYVWQALRQSETGGEDRWEVVLSDWLSYKLFGRSIKPAQARSGVLSSHQPNPWTRSDAH
jgi:ABC-type spermidine/putrescine transport system permease subunit I